MGASRGTELRLNPSATCPRSFWRVRPGRRQSESSRPPYPPQVQQTPHAERRRIDDIPCDTEEVRERLVHGPSSRASCRMVEEQDEKAACTMGGGHRPRNPAPRLSRPQSEGEHEKEHNFRTEIFEAHCRKDAHQDRSSACHEQACCQGSVKLHALLVP